LSEGVIDAGLVKNLEKNTRIDHKKHLVKGLNNHNSFHAERMERYEQVSNDKCY
jgi:hypothetical protein